MPKPAPVPCRRYKRGCACGRVLPPDLYYCLPLTGPCPVCGGHIRQFIPVPPGPIERLRNFLRRFFYK